MLLMLFKRFLQSAAVAEAEEIEQRLTPEQTVALIRKGNEELREQLISDYKPYIAKVTSRFSKRYIDPKRDDEYSVALLAFNEAINQFDSSAGKMFLGFAETVIKRRLIDYVRKEQRHAGVIPYSMYESDENEQSPYNIIETKQAIEAYEHERVAEERKNEIIALNDELHKYEITFQELVNHSPKHADSRKLLIGIAEILACDSELYGLLKNSRRMPVKELTERSSVSRKTIERNRKYIIAIAVIMSGNYPYMHDYLHIPKDSDEQREVGGR